MLTQETRFDPREEPDPCVRWRAWRMWVADGCPHDRKAEYLTRARELQFVDDRPVSQFWITRSHLE